MDAKHTGDICQEISGGWPAILSSCSIWTAHGVFRRESWWRVWIGRGSHMIDGLVWYAPECNGTSFMLPINNKADR